MNVSIERREYDLDHNRPKLPTSKGTQKEKIRFRENEDEEID